MCLILLSTNNHHRYKLIVAANRDEFHKRKTAPAAFWTESPTVLGGRDLEANGTWLGMSKSGRIALVTNYRDLKNINPSAPSRGHLVSDFLMNGMPTEQFMKVVEQKGKLYNGFNLLTGTPEELWYYSNYGRGIKGLSAGTHGLSNHLLDTPWPKVIRGKALLEPILKQREIKPTDLFEVLYDEQRAPDEHLPDTGVGLDWERVLSSMFIKSPDYGSRCSTVVLVDKQNHVLFSERVYDMETYKHTTRDFEFDIVNGY